MSSFQTSFYELIEKCLDRLDGTKIKVECLYSIYKDLINIKRELQDICLKVSKNRFWKHLPLAITFLILSLKVIYLY